MIGKRGALLSLAQEKVWNSGYQFKKGKSHSKRIDYDHTPTESDTKRAKVNKDVQAEWIKNLHEDIADINERLSFKEKRLDQASQMQNYKLCDNIKEEIIALKSYCREMECELKQFQKKEKKSLWYKKGKRLVSPSSESECPLELSVEPLSSPASTHSTVVLSNTDSEETDNSVIPQTDRPSLTRSFAICAANPSQNTSEFLSSDKNNDSFHPGLLVA